MNQPEVDDLHGRGTIGKILKSNSLWIGQGGDNKTGFSAIPGGLSSGSQFVWIKERAFFWCSTDFGANQSYYRQLSSNSDGVVREWTDKRMGLSVRCIKNQ